MPIPVSCRCGQSFAAGDHLAGKTVQCPKCQSPLVIPAPTGAPMPAAPAAPTGAPSIFDDAKLAPSGPAPNQLPCPNCGAGLKPNAVMCVECGYHLEKKKLMGQPKKPGAAVAAGGGHGGGHGSESADVMLARVAKEMDKDKEEQIKLEKAGIPWYYILGFLLFFFALMAGLVDTSDDPFATRMQRGIGFGIIVGGFIMWTIAYMGIQGEALESTSIAARFTRSPIAMFSFAFMNYKKCWPYLATCFGGFVAMAIGFGIAKATGKILPELDMSKKAPEKTSYYVPVDEYRPLRVG